MLEHGARGQRAVAAVQHQISLNRPGGGFKDGATPLTPRCIHAGLHERASGSPGPAAAFPQPGLAFEAGIGVPGGDLFH